MVRASLYTIAMLGLLLGGGLLERSVSGQVLAADRPQQLVVQGSVTEPDPVAESSEESLLGRVVRVVKGAGRTVRGWLGFGPSSAPTGVWSRLQRGPHGQRTGLPNQLTASGSLETRRVRRPVWMADVTLDAKTIAKKRKITELLQDQQAKAEAALVPPIPPVPMPDDLIIVGENRGLETPGASTKTLPAAGVPAAPAPKRRSLAALFQKEQTKAGEGVTGNGAVQPPSRDLKESPPAAAPKSSEATTTVTSSSESLVSRVGSSGDSATTRSGGGEGEGTTASSDRPATEAGASSEEAGSPADNKVAQPTVRRYGVGPIGVASFPPVNKPVVRFGTLLAKEIPKDTRDIAANRSATETRSEVQAEEPSGRDAQQGVAEEVVGLRSIDLSPLVARVPTALTPVPGPETRPVADEAPITPEDCVLTDYSCAQRKSWIIGVTMSDIFSFGPFVVGFSEFEGKPLAQFFAPFSGTSVICRIEASDVRPIDRLRESSALAEAVTQLMEEFGSRLPEEREADAEGFDPQECPQAVEALQGAMRDAPLREVSPLYIATERLTNAFEIARDGIVMRYAVRERSVEPLTAQSSIQLEPTPQFVVASGIGKLLAAGMADGQNWVHVYEDERFELAGDHFPRRNGAMQIAGLVTVSASGKHGQLFLYTIPGIEMSILDWFPPMPRYVPTTLNVDGITKPIRRPTF